MLFGETIAVRSENRMEHTDTLRGKNMEFLGVGAGDTCGYRWA